MRHQQEGVAEEPAPSPLIQRERQSKHGQCEPSGLPTNSEQRFRPLDRFSAWPSCLRHGWDEDLRLVGVRYGGDVLRDVRDDRADGVRGGERRDRDQDVPGLGATEAVLAILGVAQVVGRRDDDHERQHQRREPELAFQAADVPMQEPVGDETGKDRQQERVDKAVAHTTPEQLKDEIGAVRSCRRIFRVEDVEHEEDGEDNPKAKAPPPTAAEDLRHIDLLDPDVAGKQRDRDSEVDQVEDIVLHVEHRHAEIRNEERDGADDGEPDELPNSLRHGTLHRMRIRGHNPSEISYSNHPPDRSSPHRGIPRTPSSRFYG